nr:uncharacterized protein LOC119185527 isoform X2 [Rhipicephalus microplus]XP_037290689.1 uncharacterized protein LOC119185991 isoform X2 [Rhipicephalus microplus]
MHKTAFVLLLVISNIARILSGGSNDVHKVETTAGFTCDGGTPKRCHYPSYFYGNNKCTATQIMFGELNIELQSMAMLDRYYSDTKQAARRRRV